MIVPVADGQGSSLQALERVGDLLGSGAIEGGAAAPASAEEAGAVLRVAAEDGWRVLPLGRGIERGPEIRKAELVVTTRRFTGVTGYEPGDLTLSAAAGTTLEELDAVTRSEGQWLPLDPPGPPTCTLGGVVATGLGGPLSLGFGRPRDQVLGLTLVDGEGRVLSLGGRVVKNVAGFDLVRLATGSRGALGLITDVSLRLFPVPTLDRTLIWEMERPRPAWESGRALVGLPLPLAAVEVVVPADGPARVIARALGSVGAVDRITRELEGAAGGATRRLEGPETARFFRELAEGEAFGELVLRAGVLPDRAGELMAAAQRMAAESGSESRIAIRPGTGELRLGMVGGLLEEESSGRGRVRPDPVEAALQPFADAVDELGGTLRIVRGPEGMGSPPSGSGSLTATLQRGFDPRGILPGRWREAFR